MRRSRCRRYGRVFLVAVVMSGSLPAQQGEKSAVSALGYLYPEGEVRSISAPYPDRISGIQAEVGEFLQEGHILAVLDSFDEREKQKEVLEARLAEISDQLQTTRRHAQALIQEAELQLRLLRSTAPLEERAQEADVNRVAEELQFAEADLERLRGLVRERSVTTQEVEKQESLVDQLRSSLDSQSVQGRRLEQWNRLEILLAEARLETARAVGAKAEAALAVGSLRKEIQLAEARLERALIRAPRAGTLLKILRREGESAGEGPLFLFGDTRRMFVRAEVFETDVGGVSEGRSARITSAALPAPLEGRVIRVGQLVSRNEIHDLDPSAKVDRRIVEVDIELEDAEVAGRFVNLQVDVEILLD